MPDTVRAQAVILAALLCAPSALSTTIEVLGPHQRIQDALDAAQAGDTVLVHPGTYTGTGNRALDYQGKDLVMRSVAGAEETVIDCEDVDRGLFFHGGETRDARLEGFTITRGWAENGGAICCESASPTIERCTLRLNEVHYDGGAVNCSKAAPLIADCQIAENLAGSFGGGIRAEDSNLTVVRSVIVKNRAATRVGISIDFSCDSLGIPERGFTILDSDISVNEALLEESGTGGGIEIGGEWPCRDPDVVISGCTIRDNRAALGAGAFFGLVGSALVSDTIFERNESAGKGGGLVAKNLIMTDCLIRDNFAGGSGGGGMLFSGNSKVLLRNCRFVGNSALDDGGGLAFVSNSDSSTILDCLFRDNSAGRSGGGLDVAIPNGLLIQDCEIDGNVAGFVGGGVHSTMLSAVSLLHSDFRGPRPALVLDAKGVILQEKSTPDTLVFDRCSITSNRAGFYGGGAYLDLTDSESLADPNIPLFRRTLIAGNSAGWSGGGLSSLSKFQLYNCTIADNTATLGGRGIHMETLHGAEINSSILWNPSGEEIGGLSDSVDVSHSAIRGGWSGIGNIDLDPLFRDPTNFDYHLQTSLCGYGQESPCIDTGDPTWEDSELSCDLGLGFPRADMGAYGGRDRPTGINSLGPLLPPAHATSLGRAHPNPFNPAVTIPLHLHTDAPVRLSIHDARGALMRVLANRSLPRGRHAFRWDGRTASGHSAPSGVYLVRLLAGDRTDESRILLLK